MILGLFGKAHSQAKRNTYTPVPEGMEQSSAKVFFTRAPDELQDEKIYKLAEIPGLTQDLVHFFIKSSKFTVTAACFVNKQAEKAVSSESKFREDIRSEKPFKEEIRLPSPLIGCLTNQEGCLKTTEKRRRKIRILPSTALNPDHV